MRRLHGLARAMAGAAVLLAFASESALAQANRQRAISHPAAATSTPRGDAEAGRQKADAERCVECHGAEGQGVTHAGASATEARVPKLAGQRPEYLLKQLRDFKSGARKDDLMLVAVRNVEETDLRDIVAWFASLPRMQGPDARTDFAAGRMLYAQGDAARGIPACVSCHGDDGGSATAAGPLVPIIGGQGSHYLEQQLLQWRSGWRRNDAAMKEAARHLSDADIKSLAGHLATQR
ncbi:c-type cytochrome [Methylibium rhizosphaerae]|uniref:c-type cytochrome n=1 Tax=Methylibium rhizosphaerae TaxID=2570323 RepID=UPI001126AE00|nr:c-type cytochrome [Methylibium rhizosphaerae]